MTNLRHKFFYPVGYGIKKKCGMPRDRRDKFRPLHLYYHYSGRHISFSKRASVAHLPYSHMLSPVEYQDVCLFCLMHALTHISLFSSASFRFPSVAHFLRVSFPPSSLYLFRYFLLSLLLLSISLSFLLEDMFVSSACSYSLFAMLPSLSRACCVLSVIFSVSSFLPFFSSS